MKKCRTCGGEFAPRYNSTEMFCSFTCALTHAAKKPMKKSPKRGKQEREYTKKRKEFLSRPENRYCFIKGCGRPGTTIEHRMGRRGYADQWARDNGVHLINDERFWAACCLEHNLELENNPELSKEYQLSKIHGGKKK